MKHENRVYYNIAEANNLIPRLEYLFAKLARIQRGADAAQEDVIREINRLGVVIEDLDMGVVSFYSWIDGAEILLSWQFGENEITYWHTVKETAAARRPFDNYTRPSQDAVLH